MVVVALKLVLVPALVVGASVVERRWGPRMAGLVTALPIISGPALFFFALEQGDRFAAAAASAALVTVIAVAASTLAYAWLSVCVPWWASLAGSCVAFALIGGLLSPLHWSVVSALAVALAGVAGARAALPWTSGARADRARPGWDLGVRAVSAVSVVLVVTTLADRLGPRFSGVLAAFPIALLIVLAFTHAQQGAGAAIRFLRGFIPGMSSTAAFCFAIALSAAPLGTAVAFPLAIVLAVVVQAAVLSALSLSTRQRENPSDAGQRAVARKS